MQPGEMRDEKHTSCVAQSCSCVSAATGGTPTAGSNPIITQTKSLKADKQIMYAPCSLSLPPENNVRITIKPAIHHTVLSAKGMIKQSEWGVIFKAEQMQPSSETGLSIGNNSCLCFCGMPYR